MKKLAKLILFFALSVLVLTACKAKVDDVVNDNPQNQENSDNQENTEKEDDEKEVYKFAYSCITLDNPFFISLEASMREILESEGHTLLTLDAKSDAEQQNQQMTELIKQDIDAVFVSPVDWKKITPAVEALKKAGIKIINVDTQMKEFDLADAYVGSDNSNAGFLCGTDILERLPQGGKIIIVECPNRNSVNERIKGFEKAISGKGFQVVKRIDAKGDLDVAIPEVEAALKENPDVVAIMCGNDPMALGAIVAANTVGAKELLVYGIDGSPEAKKELVKENSILVATVGQSTIKMGKEAAHIGMKILMGEKYEEITYIDTFLINKENVEEYGIDKWQ